MAVSKYFLSYSDCAILIQNSKEQWETEVHFGFSA